MDRASSEASPSAFVEHVNATVHDLDGAIAFLAAALPEWTLRGGGTMDWFGKPIRWVHVGSDDHYLAMQSGGEGAGPDWKAHGSGIKHVGIVVPSLQAVLQRLRAAGFEPDHSGGESASRRSVYFMQGHDFQVEFVEYTTPDPALRNTYG